MGGTARVEAHCAEERHHGSIALKAAEARVTAKLDAPYCNGA